MVYYALDLGLPDHLVHTLLGQLRLVDHFQAKEETSEHVSNQKDLAEAALVDELDDHKGLVALSKHQTYVFGVICLWIFGKLGRTLLDDFRRVDNGGLRLRLYYPL